jgi:predicted NACHT family NTPase
MIDESGIIFGTDIFSHEVVRLAVTGIPHLLVVGNPGAGKSLFLHQLASQLVRRRDVERVLLVDLKGGLEFRRYQNTGIARVV